MKRTCATLSSVACLAVPYFSTLCHKRQDFHGKKYWTKMCLLIFSTIFVQNVSHSKKNWARRGIMSVHWSSCKVRVFLGGFDESWTFSTDFSKHNQILDFIKSVQWEPSGLRIDGQTDRGRQSEVTNFIVALRSFATAPKHSVLCSVRFVSGTVPPNLLGHWLS